MAQAKFKIGDVVCLKSGSPKMTIEYVYDDRGNAGYTCIWFEGSSIKKSDFVEPTLQICEEDNLGFGGAV